MHKGHLAMSRLCNDARASESLLHNVSWRINLMSNLEVFLCISKQGLKRDWCLAGSLCTQMVRNVLSVPPPSPLPSPGRQPCKSALAAHPMAPRQFPLRRSRCHPSRSLGICWRGLVATVNQVTVAEDTVWRYGWKSDSCVQESYILQGFGQSGVRIAEWQGWGWKTCL